MLQCTTVEVQEQVLFAAAFQPTCGTSQPRIQWVPGLEGKTLHSRLPFSPSTRMREYGRSQCFSTEAVRKRDHVIAFQLLQNTCLVYISPYSCGSSHLNANLMVLIACMSLPLLQFRLFKITGQGGQVRCLFTLVLAPMCIKVYLHSLCIFKAL